MRSLVASKHYQEALVVDLAERVDCDGVVTGPVSDGNRASAALALFARALNKANSQPSLGNGKAAGELLSAAAAAAMANTPKPTLGMPARARA